MIILPWPPPTLKFRLFFIPMGLSVCRTKLMAIFHQEIEWGTPFSGYQSHINFELVCNLYNLIYIYIYHLTPKLTTDMGLSQNWVPIVVGSSGKKNVRPNHKTPIKYRHISHDIHGFKVRLPPQLHGN